VTLPTAPHSQRGVHVNVVTGKIKTDQALEYDAPSRERRSEKDEQASCRASIGDHVENSAECRRLVVVSCG
jgi:hypothetical protein